MLKVTRCEFVHNLPCEQVSNRLTELQAENAKLLDENARLRSCLSDDADNARQIMGENAKLRELVRGLNWCTEGPDGPRVDCEHCPLGVVDGEPLELMCEKMMRELGVDE